MTTKDWRQVILKAGFHKPDSEMCLLEAVAWYSGEPWSDKPACVSPTLAAFGRAWNDGMRSDEEREQLKQYIPMLIGTVDSSKESVRGFMAMDWLCRVYLVAWLRLVHLDAPAQALIDHPAVVDYQTMASVSPIVNAAWAAAWAAAARDADTAAWDAAKAATTAAGAAAAAKAATAAARAAAAAAKAAAKAAAAAARAAAMAAAAGAAAGAALEPTVRELQESAHQLFQNMIATAAGRPS